MNIEELRDYCLAIDGATECFPFDDTVLVFKVMEKMFAFLSITPKDGQFKVCLKCNSEKSVELRERYRGISEGFYTKSLLWNSVCLESDVSDKLIKELINHSVSEVIGKLSKKKQEIYYNQNKTHH